MTVTGSDDSRYVFFSGAGVQAVIRDTLHHRQQALAVPPGCTLVTVGAGRSLSRCGTDAAGETVTATARSDGTDLHVVRSLPNEGVDPFAIGRHWIRFDYLHAGTTPLYIDWRTGERRSLPGTHDLNSPQLTARPRRYPPNPRILSPRYAYPGAEIPGIALRVLTGARRLTLSRCSAGCAQPQVAFGRIIWREHGELIIYSLKRARRWTVPLTGTRGYIATAYEVLTSRTDSTGLQQYAVLPPYRVARLPN